SVGWALELGAREPARQLRCVRDRQGQTQRDPYFLREPRVAERRAVLVARLVIALAVVQLVLPVSPPGGPSHKVSSRTNRQRGHAGSREGEMVRAVERAADVRLVNHGERFELRCALEHRPEGGPVCPERIDVAGGTTHV